MKKQAAFLSVLFVLLMALPMTALAYDGYRADRYLYDQLDADERAIYDTLASLNAPYTMDEITAIVHMPESTTRYDSFDFLYVAYYAYVQDNPLDGAWIDNVDLKTTAGRSVQWSGSPNGGRNLPHYTDMLLVVTPYCTADDLYAVDLMFEGMTDQATPDMSRYDRAVYIQRKVCSRLTYDHNDLYDAGTDCSPLCIRNGYAICEGFSKVYKILADKLYLPCVLSGGDGHMYVQIQMEDGGWYVLEPQGGLTLVGLDRVRNKIMYYPQMGPGHFEECHGHGAVTYPPIPAASYRASGGGRSTQPSPSQGAWPVGTICRIRSSSGNVRSGPGTDYGGIGYVNQGQEFQILELRSGNTGKDWYKISGYFGTGWVSSGIVSVWYNGTQYNNGTVNGAPLPN